MEKIRVDTFAISRSRLPGERFINKKRPDNKEDVISLSREVRSALSSIAVR